MRKLKSNKKYIYIYFCVIMLWNIVSKFLRGINYETKKNK